jgi:hypothetical protein
MTTEPERCTTCDHPRTEHDGGKGACLFGRAPGDDRPKYVPECGCERFTSPRWVLGTDCTHAPNYRCPNCLPVPRVDAAAIAQAHAEEVVHVAADRKLPDGVATLECVCGHELAAHAGGERCCMMLQEGERRGELCACMRFHTSSRTNPLAAAFNRAMRPDDGEAAPTATTAAREDERLWASYFAAFLSQGKPDDEAEALAERAFSRHQRRWGGR